MSKSNVVDQENTRGPIHLELRLKDELKCEIIDKMHTVSNSGQKYMTTTAASDAYFAMAVEGKSRN